MMDKKVLLSLLFLCLPMTALFPQSILINTQNDLVNVGKGMLLYEDNTLTISIEQIISPEIQAKFIQAQADIPTLATTTAAVWVKFLIDNQPPEKCFVQFSNPSLNLITFYALDKNDKLLKTSEINNLDATPKKEFDVAPFIFELPKDTHTVYLRVLEDEILLLDVKVGSLYALFQYNDRNVWWNALYFGIIFIMLTYNFFLYLNIKDISYLYYVIFSLSFALAFSHTQGYSYYFLGSLDWILKKYPVLMSSLSIMFGSLFAMYFLQMKIYYPKARYVIFGVVIWNIGNALMDFAGQTHLAFISMQLSAILPIYYYLGISFFTYRKGYKPAIFYFIAFLGFEVLLNIHILVGRGVIPYFSPWAGYLLHLASAWELIVLSLALAYRINILKKEKEEAQNENIKLVQEQNVVLETKIKERTSELNHLVEELNQQTEELKIINERMKVLDDFKEGMTGMIVHDLKNPLNIILGLGEKEEVVQAGKQMLNMVQDILDVQKFENTNFQLYLANAHLQSVVMQAVSEVNLLIWRKSIAVEYEIEPTAYIKADVEILNRVLVNLLTNAIKFTRNNGKIYISTNCKEVQTPENQVLLAITDTGDGIPEDKMGTIFDKFGQAEARKSGIVRSTGLGLTFCKMAIEAHEGQLGVISKPSEGATFWFTLFQGKSISQVQEEEKQIIDYQHHVLLTAEEEFILKPYITELKQFSVYEYSDIKQILEQIDYPENQHIIHWKKIVENAIRTCNEQKYNDLINL